VRDASDLCTLHALAQCTPLEGVIVGKALYEGTLSDDCWKAFG
jgi:phosphoribosylformimino-5-aminoimidazole carboxamide ribonucleotide (ProFAR) isomerase